MTPSQATIIENYEDIWEPILLQKQSDYRYANGRYAQLTRSHTLANTPSASNGALTPRLPNRIGNKPHYQQEGWPSFIATLGSTPLMASVEIHQCADPSFTVYLEMYEDGQLYQWSMNYSGGSRNPLDPRSTGTWKAISEV